MKEEIEVAEYLLNCINSSDHLESDKQKLIEKLEEAIERLDNFRTIKILYGSTFAMHLEQLNQLQEDINTVLNYIENSIPKEVVEDAIVYEKEEIKHSTDNNRGKRHEYALNALQELLEEK